MHVPEMIDLIKYQLGWPAIDLEIDDKHIKASIDNAIYQAKDHISVRKYKTYQVTEDANMIPAHAHRVDLSDLKFDVITEVYMGDNLAPYLYDQFYLVNYTNKGVPASLASLIAMRSHVDSMLNRNWKVIGNTLFVDKYYSAITVEYVPTVIELEDVEDSWYVSWIQRYATALCKEMLGRIRGKLTIDSNPFKMDADALLSESATEKESLLEEIKNRGLLEITR